MARSSTSFQKGQSGNPGGRPSTRKAELEALLSEVWTPTSRKRVLKKLVTDAEQGDHDARTLLLAYAYGKPKDDVEHTGGLRIEVVYADGATDASEAAPESATDPA